MDVARGIGERDGEAFSDRPKTGVSDDPASIRPCRSMLGTPTRANHGSVRTGVISAT
jgi:hypothetical protein